MTLGCAQADCTVADTGKCLLNNDPSTCPERRAAQEAEDAIEVLQAKAQFPSSRAYTLSDAKGLMAERYVHVVAILGEPAAGKTGCLVSLYLCVGQRHLDGFGFADSRTLMGFEEVSRGARRWNEGRIPEQFTDRTELADDRTAGFLHIRLVRTKQADRVDLLCSDLPGEWTTELIEKNRVDRLGFLRRADAIWVVVDGSETVDPGKRQVCAQRTRLLIERLGDFLGGGRRLILVVTRRDRQAPDGVVVGRLCEEGKRHGFETEAVEVASFADEGAQVAAGFGIRRLIERSTEFGSSVAGVWKRDSGGSVVFEVPNIGLGGR